MTEVRNERLLSEKEAAEYFGWSLEKMRQIRRRGKIEHFKFSSQSIKYSVEQLEAYKNSHLKQAF